MSTWTTADFKALLTKTSKHVWVCSDEVWKTNKTRWPNEPIIVFFDPNGQNYDYQKAKEIFEALCEAGDELALRAREVLLYRRMVE